MVAWGLGPIADNSRLQYIPELSNAKYGDSPRFVRFLRMIYRR